MSFSAGRKLLPKRTLQFTLCTTLLAFSLQAANAQQTNLPPLHTSPPVKNIAAAAAPHNLPVRKVVLYKNGIGYFEHTGTVIGNEHVTIDFTTAQLNDVLQSLTAMDLNGGHIAGAGYNSTTPLEQQLQSLALGLGVNADSNELYNAIRGAHVEVHSGSGNFTGRLLSIETLATQAKPDDNVSPPAVKRVLTVVGELGDVRTFELTPALNVRLLDAGLHQDLNRYLQMLADTHSQGLRHLTLDAIGSGTRNLLVSYISEVPVWKSTYRILVTPKASGETATLQGWAVIDNTVGSDWENVQLSLIAGAPQSFIQPLSQPYYARRPEIPLPSEAQTTPQTFESGEEGNDKVPYPPPPPSPAVSAPRVMSSYGYGAANGVGTGSGHGIGYGSGAGLLGETMSVDALADSVTPEEYQAKIAASVAPNTTTSAFDDYFEYKISQPVTIRKNESALVPILQASVPVEQVTLWSPRANNALRALWITNSSALTLDRGSFTLIENGEFAGEGLLDPIHAGEKRLLSYAVDTAVQVQQTANNHQLLRSVVLSKGVLTRHLRDYQTTDYSLHNSAAEDRTVILEQTRNGNGTWKLANENTPEETTANEWRFRIVVPAGKTVKYSVTQTHAFPNATQITRYSDNDFNLLIKSTDNNAQLTKALQPVFAARAKVADLDEQLKKLGARIGYLKTEEDRQRENIAALKDADKGAMARYINQLGVAEDEINTQQKEFDKLTLQRAAAQDALLAEIQKLDVNLKLAD